MITRPILYLAGVLAAGPCHPAAPPPPGPDRVPVTIVRVIDGDTLVARLPDGQATPVRLRMIDTPELHAHCPAEHAAAVAAAAAAQAAIAAASRVELADLDWHADRYHGYWPASCSTAPRSIAPSSPPATAAPTRAAAAALGAPPARRRPAPPAERASAAQECRAPRANMPLVGFSGGDCHYLRA